MLDAIFILRQVTLRFPFIINTILQIYLADAVGEEGKHWVHTKN